MHAAATAMQGGPAQSVSLDPLAGLSKHRQYNAPIVRQLMASADTRDVGRAIANCSSRLLLELPLEGGALGEPLLRGARLCNRRLCPFCEWRRTRAWRARLIRGLTAFGEERPNWSGVFLTLTVRNCQVDELRQTMQEMHQSFHRLRKVAAFPTDVWFRRTEITVRREYQAEGGSSHGGRKQEGAAMGGGRITSVHPHLHCLLLVRPSYWSRDYVKQIEWQRQWQMAARLDYAPVVDVRRAKAKRGSESQDETPGAGAVVEAAKYASKATDLLSLGEGLPAFHHEMRGLRLYAVSKELQRFVKSADPGESEMLDSPDPNLPANDQTLSAVAEWFEAFQEYRFVL